MSTVHRYMKAHTDCEGPYIAFQIKTIATHFVCTFSMREKCDSVYESKTMSCFSPRLQLIWFQQHLIENTNTFDNISPPLRVILSFHLGKLKLNEFCTSIGLMIHSVIFVLLCLSISRFQSKTHFIALGGIFHVYKRKQTCLSCSLAASLGYTDTVDCQ